MKEKDFKYKEYILPVAGLKDGDHQYDFHIGESFFKNMGWDQLDGENIDIDLNLSKHNKLMVLDFDFHGSVFCPCDRCLDPFEISLKFKDRLIIKFSPEISEPEIYEDDENVVMYVNEDTSEIDLSHFIYESIILQIPIKRAHEIDKCNSEIIKILKNYQVE